MPEGKTQITSPEWTDETVQAFTRGQQVSLEFKEAHLHDELVMKGTPENAKKIGEWIKIRRYEWNLTNLEKAYSALVEAGELEMEENPALYPQLDPVPTPKVIPPPSPQFPWGLELTKASLKALSGEKMKEYLTSKKWGAEFKRQIGALDIRVNNKSLEEI